MSSCKGNCKGNGGYVPRCSTWSEASNLSTSGWHPYAPDPNCKMPVKESYQAAGGGCCGGNYSNSAYSWTVAGNTTPANSGMQDHVVSCGSKEGFHYQACQTCNCTGYPTLCKTWSPQKRYQL